MSKFILFTAGILSARYDVAIHGDAIPADAIEVSDEVFFQTINEQDGIWSLLNGKIVKSPLPAPPPETPEAAAKRLENAVQQVLDSSAQAHGYDSASRCIGYINSTNAKWKAEAEAMNKWRDDVWAHCAQVQSDFQANKRPLPTETELIAELPVLVMP